MIEPDKVTSEARFVVFGLTRSEIVVDGLVNVVRDIDVVVLVIVDVQSVSVVVVVVSVVEVDVDEVAV